MKSRVALVNGTQQGEGIAYNKQIAKEAAAKEALQGMGWLAGEFSVGACSFFHAELISNQ